MKLEKIALIAEIVGSVAIVVTLIVLIVEMRANTDELRAATVANIAARTQAMPLALMTNPQWADVASRYFAGEELARSEAQQVYGSIIVSLKLAEEAFIAHRDGRLDEEIWDTRASLAVSQFISENSRRMIWPAIRVQGTFVPGFVEWFDAALVERYGE